MLCGFETISKNKIHNTKAWSVTAVAKGYTNRTITSKWAIPRCKAEQKTNRKKVMTEWMTHSGRGLVKRWYTERERDGRSNGVESRSSKQRS